MDNPASQEEMEKWEDLGSDPNAIREYEARHKAMMDKLAAEAESQRRQLVKYKEGIEEGERKRALEIALEMLADGMPVDMVARYAKLSIEEINQLKKN